MGKLLSAVLKKNNEPNARVQGTLCIPRENG